MEKKFRKLIGIAAVILILVSIIGVNRNSVHAQGMNLTNLAVTLEEAENVAKMHVINMMCSYPDSAWNDGVWISSGLELYGLDNNVSAYYIELADKENQPGGYVIISANKKEYPVIEFSMEGESFIKAASSAIALNREKSRGAVDVENTKIYYLGDGIYTLEDELYDGSVELYDITDSDVNLIDSDGMYTEVTEPVETYEEIWNTYEEEYAQVQLNTRSTRGSNPPEYSYITSPSDWESGYLYSSSYTTGQSVNYYTMKYFSNGGVCSPTAATNLCYYWYNKDSNRYGSLKYNGSWRSTFERLYMYMDTDPDTGSSDGKIAWGLESYLDEVGPAFYVSQTFGTNNGLLLVEEISNDRACILGMNNSTVYGFHSVLAIGYINYVYSDGNSTYIRIADGWQENANRYVWGASYGTWDYVKVIPQ